MKTIKPIVVLLKIISEQLGDICNIQERAEAERKAKRIEFKAIDASETLKRFKAHIADSAAASERAWAAQNRLDAARAANGGGDDPRAGGSYSLNGH